MLILQRQFTCPDCDDSMYADWISGNVFIENWIVRNLFDFPKSVRKIWISLHTRAAKNRVSTMVYCDPPESCPSFSLEHLEITDVSLDALLRRYVGKTVHVELEYLELP